MSIRLRALGIGLDSLTSLQVLMHEFALSGVHRLKGDRPVAGQSTVGRLVGLPREDDSAAFSIATGIDHHSPRPPGPLNRNLVCQMLDGVDRAPAGSDRPLEVLADERRRDLVIALFDHYLGLEVQAGTYSDQQSANLLTGSAFGFAGQRRRPERFLRRRGGGGGLVCRAGA